MDKPKIVLSILPETLGICHFGPNIPVPEWAMDGTKFFSITKTPGELSVVCDQDKIPGGVFVEKNWRALKTEGPVNLYTVGVIATLTEPLAKAGISIFNISTYETDYLLFEEKNLEVAVEVLSEFCEIKGK
jgi:uncharacterized protein